MGFNSAFKGLNEISEYKGSVSCSNPVSVPSVGGK
jgi:hypothetical protein